MSFTCMLGLHPTFWTSGGSAPVCLHGSPEVDAHVKVVEAETAHPLEVLPRLAPPPGGRGKLRRGRPRGRGGAAAPPPPAAAGGGQVEVVAVGGGGGRGDAAARNLLADELAQGEVGLALVGPLALALHLPLPLPLPLPHRRQVLRGGPPAEVSTPDPL
eukprot:289089-Prorocentrum_minimum.AAC.2